MAFVFRSLCSPIKKEPQVIKTRTTISKIDGAHTPQDAEETPPKPLGQPTYLTHPHLLKEGEVTPLTTKKEYQQRRQSLLNLIEAFSVRKVNKPPKQQLIIIPATSKTYMTEKIPYIFRQSTDFFYMTGCMEPDCCLVIATFESQTHPKVTLFTRDKDPHSEVWDGPRTSPEQAIDFFGVDQSLPMNELKNYIMYFLRSNKSSYLWYDFMSPIQTDVQKLMQDVFRSDSRRLWESPKPFIHKLRIKKSPAEISLMTKTCNIASKAIASTISSTRPDMTEHQLFAKVDYECRMQGANHLAYPPVVASGERANTIHYINNNHVINDGDLILMDAGCEYYGYCSDITRTWPANGQFTRAQRNLYDVVLSVQLDLIEMCGVFPTLDSLFDAMCMLLGKRLQDIGVINKLVTGDALMRKAYQFCPHHVSHYLGMDVHDTPSVPRNINIEPGMVFTIEPGVYVSSQHQDVPKEYQGLGIRIEDDILVTESGPVVLTQQCPKEVEEIERIACTSVS